MPSGNTAGAERQYRAIDGAVPNRDTEGANKRDYSVNRRRATGTPAFAGIIFAPVVFAVDSLRHTGRSRYFSPEFSLLVQRKFRDKTFESCRKQIVSLRLDW